MRTLNGDVMKVRRFGSCENLNSLNTSSFHLPTVILSQWRERRMGMI